MRGALDLAHPAANARIRDEMRHLAQVPRRLQFLPVDAAESLRPCEKYHKRVNFSVRSAFQTA
jgi:hypothetical protein